MRNRLIALALLAGCAGGGNASAPIYPTSAPGGYAEPPIVQSVNGVAHIALAAGINPATNAPGFEYDGGWIAPTIEVDPGDTITIDYTNNLPVSSTPPNMTNLHFHGMTVSPNAPADEVINTMAMPGETLHYSVPIPSDEPSGLYWYHPHPHGESNWQVESGMIGAIIVDGIEEHDAGLQFLTQRVLLLADPQDQPDIATLARSRQLIAQRVQTQDTAAYDACRPEEGRHVTVNGLIQPTIGINAGEQQLFRVVNASADRYFDLSVPGEQIGIVALDGYPVDTYPGNPHVENVSHVLVPPSGRAEFIVTGLAGGTTLQSACFDAGPDGDPNPAVTLASLQSNGTPGAAVSKSKPRALMHAVQAQPFIGEAPPPPAAQRQIILTENVVSNQFFINAQAYTPGAAPQIVAKSGTVEQWTVLNESGEVHAFHVHQVHFLVEAINGVPQSTLNWLDTVNVPYETPGNGTQQPGSVTLLVDLRDPIVRGTFVYHCHILEHEDGGMMAKIVVQ
ncbi:MAG: multicopper oxidase family protein [Candidatus Aquilonibacter sp.]